MASEPLETLRNVQVAPRLIEEYRPLTESLEWRLSELYWATAGTRGFVQGEVPYTITSSGALSDDAARLLFANCREYPPDEAIQVLEIGAGTGLFARLFLDAFARICEAEGKAFHRQIVYFVTDGSRSSLEQWKELRVFDGQPAVLARSNALDPLNIETADGPRTISGLRAVFCNYCLDSLPASVLRKGESGPEELCIRTHLTPDAARLAHHTRLTLPEIRELARNLDPALLPLVSVLEFEAGFQPCGRAYPHLAEALTFGHNWPRIILNHGAITCLEKAAAGLDPHGFLLLNDYGLVRAEDAASMGGTQRFGSSAALGLNFPFLEHCFCSNGTTLLCPELDERLSLHPRLLTHGPVPQTQRAFRERFGGEAYRTQVEPQEAARKHIEAGRMEAAKQAYEAALGQRPRDWVLLGEIAEFLIRQIASYEAGLDIAAAALAINPWYSVWLWNVKGDALYALERYTEAFEAYREAEKMEPGDVRTNLNLGYSYSRLGDPASALSCLARGLANDRAGVFRDRLLEKQQQILAGTGAVHADEMAWLARRAARLNNG